MNITPTVTQFCHQTWQLESSVLHCEHHESGSYLVTKETVFHPVSHIWPDHPADTGILVIDGQKFDVADCVVGAFELESETLYVGEAIPVKRDTQGWVFVVVHNTERLNHDVVGLPVTLEVNQARQEALSRGHSAGHIAFLALNKVLAQSYWRKDADRKDPHGFCDFNSYAQVTSFVDEDCCIDVYRIGKTLRKRGLNSADVFNSLKTIEEQVNKQIMLWLLTQNQVDMRLEGSTLTDSRYWRCDLGEGKIAEIPCGGTHVTSLNEFSTIEVTLTEKDSQHIEMHTNVIRA